MDIQTEANAEGADLVIALTRSDELNILACLAAKKLGARNTIAVSGITITRTWKRA